MRRPEGPASGAESGAGADAGVPGAAHPSPPSGNGRPRKGSSGSGGAADDADADFSRFVAGRWRALTHTAYLLTGDFHEAEDLVQATLVKVYPHWRRVRPDTAEQYVRRALVNTNRSRHRRRRVVHLLLPALPDHSAVEHGAGGPGGAGAGERDALVRALAELPERQRAVVVLRYWEDLSAEEVAATLRCSVGTVKSQASRALAKLRRSPALADHVPAPHAAPHLRTVGAESRGYGTGGTG